MPGRQWTPSSTSTWFKGCPHSHNEAPSSTSISALRRSNQTPAILAVKAGDAKRLADLLHRAGATRIPTVGPSTRNTVSDTALISRLYVRRRSEGDGRYRPAVGAPTPWVAASGLATPPRDASTPSPPPLDDPLSSAHKVEAPPDNGSPPRLDGVTNDEGGDAHGGGHDARIKPTSLLTWSPVRKSARTAGNARSTSGTPRRRARIASCREGGRFVDLVSNMHRGASAAEGGESMVPSPACAWPQSALVAAAASPATPRTKQLVNSTDFAGLTALHYAASLNRADMVKLLLEYGADANQKTKAGLTPLHYAAENDATEAACALVQDRACPHMREDLSWQPLHCASWNHSHATAMVLLAYGANPHADVEGDANAVSLARTKGHNDLERLLESAREPFRYSVFRHSATTLEKSVLTHIIMCIRRAVSLGHLPPLPPETLYAIFGMLSRKDLWRIGIVMREYRPGFWHLPRVTFY
eukprot:m.30035 g.30035  ORF g.30035 m.30035 type:complete len:472 (+) comp4659_c0_seq1:250-1665(+)